MADFLEERLLGTIKYGSSYTDDYAVEIATTAGGQEYRSLIHPFPLRKFDISYLLDLDATYANLQAVYHRAHGRYAGFRARCADEFSSNIRIGTPTPFDQPMALVSAGVYQLQKLYGTDKPAGSAGYPCRTVFKPVAGTVRVAIGTTEVPPDHWTLDATTGRVTFEADKTYPITSISKASQAVIGFASHTFNVGHSIQISGVLGMTQINGMRAAVLAVTGTSVTVNIDSSAFSTWTSGGTTHSRPQAGEAVTAGFEFDFPVRFNTSLPVGQDYPTLRSVDGVELVELLNP